MMKLVVLTAMLAAVAMADGHCALESGVVDYFAAPTGCSAYDTCASAFCGDADFNTTDTNVLTCANNNTMTCSAFSTLVGEYISCVAGAAMMDSCQDGSSGFGSLKTALADDSEADYMSGSVYKSCVSQVCQIADNFGSECDLSGSGSGMYGAVCMYTPVEEPTASSSSSDTTESSPEEEPSPEPTPSGAASVSTAVLAVLATLALLL